MDATALRLIWFFGALAGFGVLERVTPWGPDRGIRRQGVNLGLGFVDAVALRLVAPLSLVWAAAEGASLHVGVLYLLPLPTLAKVALGIIAMDLLIYWQHVAAHYVGFLWRVHCVHHTDIALDVTSGVRFHPCEMFISLLIKAAGILIFGVPVAGVVAFEILLNVSSVFSHANLQLPHAVDRALRWLLVTPAMHRVHHSALDGELNHNFGFNLSVWDRLFRTYLPQSAVGEASIPLGLSGRLNTDMGLFALLVLPFRRKA